MTLFNLLQLLLAGGALLLIVRRGHALSWQVALDRRVFLAALAPALEQRHRGLAETLAEVCRPAWCARMVLHIEQAHQGTGQGAQAAAEFTEDLELEVRAGWDAIAACARMAPPLAFIGVVIEVSNAFSGGSGLLALQRGLVESLSLGRALLTFTIGLSTTLVCSAGLGLLRRQAAVLRDDVRTTVREMLASLEGSSLDRKTSGV